TCLKPQPAPRGTSRLRRARLAARPLPPPGLRTASSSTPNVRPLTAPRSKTRLPPPGNRARAAARAPRTAGRTARPPPPAPARPRPVRVRNHHEHGLPAGQGDQHLPPGVAAPPHSLQIAVIIVGQFARIPQTCRAQYIGDRPLGLLAEQGGQLPGRLPPGL